MVIDGRVMGQDGTAFSDLNSSLRELISLDIREFEKQELDGN